MSWVDRLRQDPTLVHGMFSPAAGGNVRGARQGVLASYRGPGREAFLGFFERRGKLPEGTRAAAEAGAAPIDLGKAVHDFHLANGAGAEVGIAGAEVNAVRAAQQGHVTLGMVAGVAREAGVIERAVAPAVPKGFAELAKLAQELRIVR